MVAIVGAKEGGPVDEVVEQVGDLEQAGVVTWGCGLCQGRFPAAAAAVVVAVADTVVGRAGIIVVVVVVAAVVASVVAAVASDPVGLSTGESKGIQGHEGCKDICQRLGQRRILGSFGSIGLSGGIAILRGRNFGILALILWRVLTLGRLLPIVAPWLLTLLGVWRPTYWALGVTYRTYLLIGLDPLSDWALRLLGVMGLRGLKHRVYGQVGVALEISSLTFSSSGMGQRTLAASECHRSA
ncbi:hypothetical protein Taro_028945 [Colocasia esculenta]|uniref:Uncharacterized protein n=1 Tax=Colocasia esculenta TaxID=4460 RepID=A0A843VVQ3_COLES|nr:hypothetical protein [Colocasia esculenta]